MNSQFARVVACLTITLIAVAPQVGGAQEAGLWLDEATLPSWNEPGAPIPAAPTVQGDIDPRCQELARPAELDEDRLVVAEGWQLSGAYQGGWDVVVILGTANYDGMCRPLQYQGFVFVGGVFAGTLSPQFMDSRTDGALGSVFFQETDGTVQVTAVYARYATEDPLCCPSRTTSVVFAVEGEPPVLRPVSAFTSPTG